MNLQQLRDLVRGQLQVDETDLPNETLDPYLQDGFDRAIALESRWPFFEKVWTEVSVAADTPSFLLPVDTLELDRITGPNGGLREVPHEAAEDHYGIDPATGDPCHWSKVGRDIFLWPVPAVETPLKLRGFRAPTDWIAGGAAAEVDADRRLHLPIAWYAVSLAYAGQEDEVLEEKWLKRFAESAGLAREAIMRPWKGESLILGGGSGLPRWRQTFDWDWGALP